MTSDPESQKGSLAGAYACLITASVMWGFVGVLVKVSQPMVDSWTLSFLRFAVGVVFLLVFMRFSKVATRIDLRHPLVWLAAAGKAANYILENLGLSMGPAWGNVIVGPVQTVALVLFAAVLLGERITVKKVFAIACCIIGVLLVKARDPGGPGLPLAIIVLMVCSGLGAAVHVYLTRRLAGSMASMSLNASVFLAAALITALPLPAVGHAMGPVSILPVLAVTGLGLITALSFHFFTLAVRAMPMIQVTIIANIGFLLTPFWSLLFFGTVISWQVLVGIAISLAGIVLVSLPARRPA